jgi:glutamate formiminotransferase
MLECVPNFSEGRNHGVVRAIVDAIESAPGILLLGWEADADHNRSVVTFAGPADAVVEAAVRGTAKAFELIDLSRHQGEHPRTGAADVVPFVPLGGAPISDAIDAAHRAGDQIWGRFGIPVYFYGKAARTPQRAGLEKIRKNGFDGAPPDVGSLAAHPTAGAVMAGARGFLIAYNVDLNTPSNAAPGAAIAKAIALRIRESSGGFRGVKAMGLYLTSRGCAQVSMNLTDFAVTPFDQLFAAIEEEAGKLGASVRSSEIIGFVPLQAFTMAPAFFRRAANFNDSRIVETRIGQLLHSK